GFRWSASWLSGQAWRLKYSTSRSCFSAAARVLNVPRFRRLPVAGLILREYSLYPPELSLRIIGRPSSPSLHLKALFADDTAVARTVGVNQRLQLRGRAGLGHAALGNELFARIGHCHDRPRVGRNAVHDRSRRPG